MKFHPRIYPLRRNRRTHFKLMALRRNGEGEDARKRGHGPASVSKSRNNASDPGAGIDYLEREPSASRGPRGSASRGPRGSAGILPVPANPSPRLVAGCPDALVWPAHSILPPGHFFLFESPDENYSFAE